MALHSGVTQPDAGYVPACPHVLRHQLSPPLTFQVCILLPGCLVKGGNQPDLDDFSSKIQMLAWAPRSKAERRCKKSLKWLGRIISVFSVVDVQWSPVHSSERATRWSIWRGKEIETQVQDMSLVLVRAALGLGSSVCFIHHLCLYLDPAPYVLVHKCMLFMTLDLLEVLLRGLTSSCSCSCSLWVRLHTAPDHASDSWHWYQLWISPVCLWACAQSNAFVHTMPYS